LKDEEYMGSEEMERQRLNVYRMRMLGAKVHKVESGSKTLKDSINEALRDWVSNIDDTYYLIGSVVGPHPYPTMVRDFQCVIGREARRTVLTVEGRLPSAIVACVGGGSNAIGIFHPFLHDMEVELYGVEAAGKGIATGQHAASLVAGREGVLHGMYTYVLQDQNGQIETTDSISAGLDYSAVGPEHSHLMMTGRTKYAAVTDAEALDGFKLLSESEGRTDIIEIGIPFSDPIADGPVIQSSSQRSLAHGTTPRIVLEECREISGIYPEIPLVILTYYNPVLAIGLDHFMRKARDSGVSGVVVPDLPVEESGDYRSAAIKNGIDTIFLSAPNTSETRLVKIIHNSTGFLYLVSLFGVTGPRDSLSELAISSVKH